MFIFFFFKQKTAYEMRISDWSSDVCSSDLSIVGCCLIDANGFLPTHISERSQPQGADEEQNHLYSRNRCIFMDASTRAALDSDGDYFLFTYRQDFGGGRYRALRRSDMHTSELPSLMRISYADFCLKKQQKETKT